NTPTTPPPVSPPSQPQPDTTPTSHHHYSNNQTKGQGFEGPAGTIGCAEDGQGRREQSAAPRTAGAGTNRAASDKPESTILRASGVVGEDRWIAADRALPDRGYRDS
ncbi:MAG: hypothetical protein LBE08_03875, partial [Bifidobacteriaceae bacterium]|nr:hypothetical protein [Bifidobacteriaceae bacterium]